MWYPAGLPGVFRSLVIPVVLLSGIVLGGIALLQDRLLYFPQTLTLTELLTVARQDRLQAWPDEKAFRGLMREPGGTARATLVLFHGNAGHAGHRADYAELSKLGVRVILAEYPGYGPRAGEVGEAPMVADAIATLSLARQQFPGPLLLAGESLGAGVAAAAFPHVAEKVDGLLLITPWNTLAAIAAHHYPWLPVEWLLRDRYDSVANLSAARVPTAIVVADKDSIVPAQYGRVLFDQLATAKRLFPVAGAEHNDWIDRVDPLWWQELLIFLIADGADGQGGISAPGRRMVTN